MLRNSNIDVETLETAVKNGDERSADKLFKFYQKLSQNGDFCYCDDIQKYAASAYEISIFYHDKEDIENSINWLYLAAQLGNPDANYSLAMLYDEGNIFERNEEKSVYHCQIAAETGLADAQNTLSSFYFYGTMGLEEDHNLARKWAKKAAERGHPDAQYQLGLIYLSSGEASKALELFEKSANQGVRNAKCGLGILYMGEDGIKRDIELARKWLTIAAEDGCEIAAQNLKKIDSLWYKIKHLFG